MSEIPGSKQRLLIVDDSRVIRVTARKILQNHFDTVEAVDGNNAWDILTSQEPFSLIVSDLTMPNMDGFALLEKIRGSHLPHVRNIPVIIITGANDSEATMQRATAAGATDFIGKPFDSVHLLARTQAHAGSYQANNALTEENISLEDQSQVDTLTGLANDTAFMEQGRAQLAYAVRHNAPLALACLEIDDFGELVRAHDPAAGELVIKSVGSALVANIRKEDVAARIGAARFALLLPGMDANGVSRVSARITGDVRKHAVIAGGKQVRFTVSIGITAPPVHADLSLDDLLSAASDSLRQAIARGGNQVMTDERGRDAAESGNEWTLEPVGGSDTAEGAETLPDIEELQLEVLEPLPAADDETATGLDEFVLEDELQLDESPETATTADLGTMEETVTAADEVEETIIITSPYSLYDLEDVELAEPAEAADSPAAAADEEHTGTAPAPDTTPSGSRETYTAAVTADDGDSESAASRPGIFRRLLGALFGSRN